MAENGEEEYPAENGEDNREEDWNRFMEEGTTQGEAEEEEVVAEWRPSEPVTPQEVLGLNRYTTGELAFFPQHAGTSTTMSLLY